MPLDDYTLAAFLSGELSEDRRKTVAAALVEDAEARETLHLACLALAAALDTESGRDYLEDRASRAPARPGRRAWDRSPFGARHGEA